MGFDSRQYWLDKYMDEKSKLIEIDSQLANLITRRRVVYNNCRKYHSQYRQAVTNEPIVDLDSLDCKNIFEEILEEEVDNL